MSSFRALAVNTLAEALRSRIVLVLAIVLVALVGWLPAVLPDDGTPAGRAYLAYHLVLSIAHAVLCLATAWLAADLVNRDVREGGAELLATRPMSRAAWWLGRWVGVVLAAWLLLACAVALVALRCHALPPATHAVSRAEQREVIDLSSGAQASWRFAKAPPATASQTILTFRVHSMAPVTHLPMTLTVGGATQVVEASIERETLVAVDPKQLGSGEVTLRNDSPVGAIMERAEAPRLSWPTSNFASNLARAVWLMALQLAFLAALGGLAASRLSFPVAAFAVGAYLLAAAHAPLIAIDSVAAGAANSRWLTLGPRLGLFLTDGLHRWWPTAQLARGELISNAELWSAVWRLGLVQTGLVVVVAVALWTTREFGLGEDV